MQLVFEITLKDDKSRATTLIYDFEKASTGYITALVSEFKKIYMVQNVRHYKSCSHIHWVPMWRLLCRYNVNHLSIPHKRFFKL